jgi:hypothetical protein
MALEAGVNGGCPKGFYCALKKEGGEWCTGHNECLSGECVVGVGCAMTSNDVSGNGCSVDSDCDDGFQCRSSVCYVPDIPQVVESTTTDEPNNSRTGLSSGAIAGLAVAVLLSKKKTTPKTRNRMMESRPRLALKLEVKSPS